MSKRYQKLELLEQETESKTKPELTELESGEDEEEELEEQPLISFLDETQLCAFIVDILCECMHTVLQETSTFLYHMPTNPMARGWEKMKRDIIQQVDQIWWCQGEQPPFPHPTLWHRWRGREEQLVESFARLFQNVYREDKEILRQIKRAYSFAYMSALFDYLVQHKILQVTAFSAGAYIIKEMDTVFRYITFQPHHLRDRCDINAHKMLQLIHSIPYLRTRSALPEGVISLISEYVYTPKLCITVEEYKLDKAVWEQWESWINNDTLSTTPLELDGLHPLRAAIRSLELDVLSGNYVHKARLVYTA